MYLDVHYFWSSRPPLALLYVWFSLTHFLPQIGLVANRHKFPNTLCEFPPCLFWTQPDQRPTHLQFKNNVFAQAHNFSSTTFATWIFSNLATATPGWHHGRCLHQLSWEWMSALNLKSVQLGVTSVQSSISNTKLKMNFMRTLSN